MPRARGNGTRAKNGRSCRDEITGETCRMERREGRRRRMREPCPGIMNYLSAECWWDRGSAIGDAVLGRSGRGPGTAAEMEPGHLLAPAVQTNMDAWRPVIDPSPDESDDVSQGGVAPGAPTWLLVTHSEPELMQDEMSQRLDISKRSGSLGSPLGGLGNDDSLIPLV